MRPKSAADLIDRRQHTRGNALGEVAANGIAVHALQGEFDRTDAAPRHALPIEPPNDRLAHRIAYVQSRGSRVVAV